MRKDIEIHIQTGDITLPARNKYKLRTFQWVSNPTGLVRYIYGEIEVPSVLLESQIQNEGLYIHIPYTPQYKEFMVRIKRVYDENTFAYLQNPVNGSDWFLVKVGLFGKDKSNAFASQLIRVADNENYYLQFNEGEVNLFAADEADMHIVKADRQNANMLLACVPTNNYRYPLSGVGLIRWTNGNTSDSVLADRIRTEFLADGVTVNDAAYDFTTKEMQLDLNANNAQ